MYFFERYFKLKTILIYVSMKEMKKKLKIVEADISCSYMRGKFFSSSHIASHILRVPSTNLSNSSIAIRS